MKKICTIAVLGGSGFVGRHLLERMNDRGYTVRLLSRNGAMVGDQRTLPRVQVMSGDPYDPSTLAALFQGCDAVINLVGILNESGFGGAGFQRAHVELPDRVMAAMQVVGVRRYLHMSSLGVGKGESHYLKSRALAAERVVSSGLDWTIFEPSVIFGPGDGLVVRFASLLKLAPVLPLARPNALLTPVYVGDVVRVMLAALDGAAVAKRLELVGPKQYRLIELVQLIAARARSNSVIVPLPDALGRLQALAMDFVPGKPFSTDNYLSLKVDSVSNQNTLAAFGIMPTALESVIDGYVTNSDRQRTLDAFRKATTGSSK
jgi:uncharacterized protein YbjT (DUF2867 family)